MPSIFSHAAFACALGRASITSTNSIKFWLLTAICAMLPDADGISFVFRIPYDSLFGHRGITHSILFAVLTGLAVTFIAFRKNRPLPTKWMIVYFSLGTLTHPLLDMLTNGGSGVALFAPIDDSRYFFPWRPIEVSPIGLGFFSERGMAVFASELLWVWLPAVLILILSLLIRKLRERK